MGKIKKRSSTKRSTIGHKRIRLNKKRINALMYQENKCLNKEDCITDCLEVIDKQIKMLEDKML